jgi:putative ABC transport system substrate-binding protein
MALGRHFIYDRSAMPNVGYPMRRRDVLRTLTGFAVAAPNLSRAEQSSRQRLVALAFGGTSDPDSKARIEAVQDGMARLGWVQGRNLSYEYFFAGNSAQQAREISKQILATSPDVILTSGTIPTTALHEATKTVPLVFVNVTDPVAGGFVASLSRPGGNVTGFTPFQYPIAEKWLELLREITPNVSRVALLGDPLNHNFRGFWAEFEASANRIGVRAVQAPVNDAGEIERNIRAMAVEPNGGLIITAAQFSVIHRELIIDLAAQLKLPAVYWSRFFPQSGGLASYGPDGNELHRQSTGYLDRILRGEKPEDLPVQEAIKFETVLNLKTANVLNLTVPSQMLARADEVIE